MQCDLLYQPAERLSSLNEAAGGAARSGPGCRLVSERTPNPSDTRFITEISLFAAA